MPEITIITVVRNNLEGLKQTWQSLHSQTDQNFYWLVVDGGSTDGSVEWLKGIDQESFHFESGPDKSLFEAMNKGIGIMATEYCLFLNGGDYFCDERVMEKLNAAIASGPFIVAYGMYVLGATPGFKTRVRGRHIRTSINMFFGPVPCHQSMVLSRRAFAENGLYREDLGIFGDTEWMLRYCKKRNPSTFSYLPFVIPCYEPKGLSYLRFFAHQGVFFSILKENANSAEYLAGLLGWCRTAIYVLVSRTLDKVRGTSS